MMVGVCVAPAAMAQADWSAKVLKTKDTDKKEQVASKSARSGVSSEVMAKLVAHERHAPAVALVAGRYFEDAKFDQNTPDVLRLIARRPDIGAQAIAYASMSPMAPELIVGLSASESKEDQQVAARMLAATAVMRLPEDRMAKRLAKKAGGKSPRLDINYRVQAQQLLNNSEDDIALEYTLLAVGIDRIDFAKDVVAPHTKNREPAVALAAQFALASLNLPIDEPAVLQAIGRAPKREKGRPALSYDPRQTPRIYAIRAAGEAKLVDAIEPLMALVNDEDLHTAVEAARALGKIGGKGCSVRLLDVMDANTVWPVRVAIYDAAGANPEKATIDLLREKFIEETGRFRQDALYAMLSIVAGQPGGMTIQAFEEWWAINGEAFVVDAKASVAWRNKHTVGQVDIEPVAGFYESSVISDRPVFAVDASLSMKGAQIDSLKQTLVGVVDSFPERVKFNIVDFGGHVRVLAEGGLIPAKNRRRAMMYFIDGMELTYLTRSYDAIERAMRIPEMDTVHFLSDGAPVGGHIDGWPRINYAFRLFGQTAPVAIHMIYFPQPGAAADAAKHEKSPLAVKMKLLTAHHAGKFHVIVAAPAKK